MKKLMMMVAAVATVLSVQAAQVDWYAYSDSLPDGATAYLFDGGDVASTMAAFLTSGNYEDSSAFDAAIASYSGSVIDGGYADGTLVGVGDYVSMLVVGSKEEGETVYIADILTPAITVGKAIGSSTFKRD